jgi:hypothetical protein
MLLLIKRVLAIGVAASMAVVVAMLAVVFGLFVWKFLAHDHAQARFEAPSGRWTLRVEDSCVQVTCLKLAHVVIPNGWLSSNELQCDIGQAAEDRVVFDKVHATAWHDNDTAFEWSAGVPPVSGRIDLRKDCYIPAYADDRPNLTTLRFKENCLVGECSRSVDWIQVVNNELITTPCRVAAVGNAPVFTRLNDPGGQVAVKFDTPNKRAQWKSADTGQRGNIDFATDCDVGRQTRRQQPS